VSPLTLTVLGCDGSHAGPGGAGSGYLVRDWSSGTAVWLDAGPGTFANLQRFTDPMALTAIVLSHEHVDHWSDLEGLVTAAKWTAAFDRAPIPVVSAPGIRHRLTQDTHGVFDWLEVNDGDDVQAGGLRLRFSRTAHPVTTLAVRLEGASGVLGYSADSGPRWPLRTLGQDLDLVLCEATYTDDYAESDDIHMSGTQAGRAAKEARARRLVLTHRWAKIPADAVLAEASAMFAGRIDAAEVGRGFSL